MDIPLLPNFSLGAVLIGYLVTQLAMAGIIYWILSTGADRRLRTMFVEAGKEHFAKGFDDTARDMIFGMMQDSQKRYLSLAYDHINKELAATTTITRDLVADRLREIDGRLLDLRDTIRRVEQIREDMHETNVSVAALHDRLGSLFEKLNAME